MAHAHLRYLNPLPSNLGELLKRYEKVLVPGVVDSTSNYIEHPELVAQRLCNYADAVGRERVLAGTDCGFSTFSGYPTVHPDIAWQKLAALADGAQRASDKLWP